MTVCPMADVLAPKNKGKLNAELTANLFSKKISHEDGVWHAET